MTEAWHRFVAFLRSIPGAVWAVFATALALAGLYLRGRRLEAELAQAKLRQTVSQAHAGIAKDEGRAEVHLERVREQSRRIEEIETARALAAMSSKTEEKRLNALSPDRAHLEYMKLLAKKRLELEASRSREIPGKITLRPKRKPPLPYEE